MRSLSSCLGAIILFSFTSCGASAGELFNSRDFTGWKFDTSPAADISTVCKILPDGVIVAMGLPVGFIATTASYENYRLHVEWRWPDKPGNSGVLLHITAGPKDRAWPISIQLQTKNKFVGDILPMAGATFAEPLTSAAGAPTPIKARTAADSEKPAGEWNSYDVLCQGATIEVSVNGVLQNKITKTTPHAGRIGLQFEGTPFEFRHFTLTPLK